MKRALIFLLISAILFTCSFALFRLLFIGNSQIFRSYRNCGYEKIA